MKKCEKCGAIQKDERTTCIDCGSILGKPIQSDGQEQIDEEIADYIDDISYQADDFYISTRDKIIAGLCLVGIIFLLIVPNILGVFNAYHLLGVFSLLLCITFAIFPKFIWFLHKLPFIWYTLYHELEPSDFYLVITKAIKYILFIIGFIPILKIIFNLLF